jgi:hypothetical protein
MPYFDRNQTQYQYSEHYSQTEFDYFCRDREGNLAMFSTGGFGWVPDEIIARWDPEDDDEDGEDILGGYCGPAIINTSSLPKPAEPINMVDRSLPQYKLYEHPPEFLESARRGLYVYNWSSVTESYVLVLKPTNPARFVDLDEETAESFDGYVYDADFAETAQIK